MKTLKSCLLVSAVLLAGTLMGCSSASTKSPDVSANVRNALAQAGMKDVSVSEDRDKGVVTLTGHVPTDAAKGQAQSIAEAQDVAAAVPNVQ